MRLREERRSESDLFKPLRPVSPRTQVRRRHQSLASPQRRRSAGENDEPSAESLGFTPHVNSASSLEPRSPSLPRVHWTTSPTNDIISSAFAAFCCRDLDPHSLHDLSPLLRYALCLSFSPSLSLSLSLSLSDRRIHGYIHEQNTSIGRFFYVLYCPMLYSLHLCLGGIAFVQELLDVLGGKVPAHGLLGQELCALNALDTQLCTAPAWEGLVHFPLA